MRFRLLTRPTAVLLLAAGFAASLAAPNSAPQVIGVAPSSGNGWTQTFALSYADPDGISDLSTVWVDFSQAVAGANVCLVYYAVASNSFYLVDDPGANWLGPVT